MAELDVQASFIITIGHGQGPEAYVTVSVQDENGAPYVLDVSKPHQFKVFIALSAAFGAMPIDCDIVNASQQKPGFYALQIKAAGVPLKFEQVGPSSLGVVVDDTKSRGQCLACDCGAADVSKWWHDTTHKG